MKDLNPVGDTPKPDDFKTKRERIVTSLNNNLSPEDTKRELFLNKIKPALARDAAVPKEAKTNIVGSEIAIELYNHAEPARRRVYTIPHARHIVIDDQIEKWKREGSVRTVNGKNVWTDEVEASFQVLGQAVAKAPILSLPDCNHEFRIHATRQTPESERCYTKISMENRSYFNSVQRLFQIAKLAGQQHTGNASQLPSH
ncbi:hypothetical protein BCR33DRAFT_736037 [Rhizoclosmatium globosum]|uniref:Uncharacterized protein n=1 Tax=Rhizoclosmatium globosum TaxID=329046 RepID=A0A1Y2CLL9_9FUNG|nr:hypothetical protein BCR33DRAFT_736037 [Rhizoclosmatium globosum]|eukprot:ORY47900.1 hypothetical protein BCR33DRAFT_736037 [Rhizoclosmatium globosum]